MKKIILMLAMVFPMLASAQKLAYINSQELFAQMPELKVVEQKLDSLNKEYEALYFLKKYMLTSCKKE